MSFGQLTCTIYNSNLTVNSTINDVVSARGKRIKSRAGTGTATFPATATNVDNIEHGMILDVYMPSTIGGDLYVTVFIVDNIVTTERDGQETITASGPTLLHELTYRIIADAAINGRTGSAISQIMAFDSNWSYYIFAGLGDASEDVYLTCAGENVFEALRQAHEQAGDDFVLYDPRPPSRTIEWLRTEYGSGAKLLEPTYAAPVNEAIGEGPILDIRKKDTANQTVTRVTAYGAGMGADRVTITDTPAVRRFALEAAFPDFSFDWTNSVITNDALELTGHPIREQVRAWTHIKPEDATDSDDVEDAATSLAYAAAKWLTDRNGSQVYYSVTTILHRDVNPGMNIEVTYSGDELSLSGNYIIHDLSNSVAADGIRTTVMTVSNSTAEERDDSRAVVSALKSAEAAANHTTAPATGGGTTTPIDHDQLLGLLDDDHTQYLRADGSRNLTGDLLVAATKTIDGVDVSVLGDDFDAHIVTYGLHIADADAHHNWPLLDGDIPASIARDSEVTAAIAAHTADDDAHHDLVTVSGLGLGLANQLVTLTSSNNPGAAAAILATDGTGELTLDHAEITNNLVVSGDFTVGSNVLFVDESQGGVGINRTPDSQFDLDVLGNIRSGGYIVGKHAIQLDDAVLIAHFDGPRPFETDFTGSAQGHMGQQPTITGPEVYRPGKFGKALQVAEATANLVKNPVFESSLTYWTATNGTASRNSDFSWIGSACAEIDATGSGALVFTYGNSVVTAGNDYTASAQCRADNDENIGLRILWYGPGGTPYIGASSVSYVSAQDEWKNITVTDTAPVGAGVAYLQYRSEVTPTAGNLFYLDAVQLEQKAYPTPLCYGDMPDHTWSGTAHASTSSRPASYTTYDIENISANAGTILMWVNLLAPIPQASIVWCAGDANAELDAYISSSSVVTFRINGGTAATADISAHAGDWVALAFTWDDSDASLYVNGELIDSGSVSSAPTLHSSLFGVGYSPLIGTSYLHNGWIDDLVTADRSLSADEILAIYESNAPVFAESSSWSFKLPNNLVWADEDGLFMVTEDGDAAFGMIGVDSKSWGGFTADAGDLVIGNTAGNSLYWDSSAGTLTLTGALSAADGVVVIDDGGIDIKSTTFSLSGDAHLIKFSNSGTTQSSIFGYWASGGTSMKLSSNFDNGLYPSEIILASNSASGSPANETTATVNADVILLNADEIGINSTTYKLRRNGAHIEWYNGSSWVQLD